MPYVHPTFVRQGVASALLRTAEDTAQANGLTQLSTAAKLTARPFFERHGFQVIMSQTAHPRDLPFRNFQMTKRVASRSKNACRPPSGGSAYQSL